MIIDSLAKAEKVTVSDQEIQQVLYYEAMRSGQNPTEAIEQYEKNGMIPVIKMSMVEDKILTKIIEDKNTKKTPAKKEAK